MDRRDRRPGWRVARKVFGHAERRLHDGAVVRAVINKVGDRCRNFLQFFSIQGIGSATKFQGVPWQLKHFG